MLKIYKASAGSGKTFTLAREYITLILGEKQEDGTYRLARRARDRHRAILAITFTNKATEEMKNRIVHELAVLAGREPGWTKKSDYEDYLLGLFGCTAGQLRAAATVALDDLLNDFNSFNVSTIDSFFQLVLRTFAREAEIDGAYEVELDDEAVIELGIDEMLNTLSEHGIAENAYLMQWLETYMSDNIEVGKTFNVFNRASELHKKLIKFIKDITDETFQEHRREIMDYLSDPERLMKFNAALWDQIDSARRAIARTCCHALGLIRQRGIPDKGVLNVNVVKLLKKFESGRSDDGKVGTTLGKVLADIGEAYVKGGKNSPLRDADLDAAILAAFTEISRTDDQKFNDLLRKNLFHLGLLYRLEECIAKFRADNATILLSDTNAILSKIINNEDTPFVYERLGQQLDNFLIDEFQDTSKLQWENLLPLVSQDINHSDSLVIGDEKQCIYRFRNSEPRLLRELDNNFRGLCDTFGNTPQENTNWRSSSEVVRFNNTLFSALAETTDNKELYRNVVQLVSPKHREHRGYVKIKDFSDLADADKDTRLAEQLTFMTEELQRALDDGYRPADVAILVRTGAEGQAVIAHLLRMQVEEGRFKGVRFVSDSSIVVGQSEAVRLIISVMRYLTSTDDVSSSRKKSRREVARLLNRHEFFRNRSLSASDALVEALHSPEVIEDIAAEAIAVNCLNLSTVVERIISRYIPKESRRRENLFLCAFHDLVNDFTRNGSGDIISFLEWWDETGSGTPVAGVADADSLTVMTIHKAKGLEYKVVLVPFGGAKNVEVKEVKWFEMPPLPGIDPEIVPKYIPLNCVGSQLRGTPFEEGFNAIQNEVIVDELNVLYVALTRAVDRLIVGLSPHVNKVIVADMVRAAIEKCDAAYVGNLGKEVGVDKYSGFIPLKFNEESIIEIGECLPPAPESAKPRTAMTPADGKEMPAYWGDDRDDLWDGVKVDRERRYDYSVPRFRGSVIHNLLARVKSAGDVDSIILRMVREGELPREQADAVRETVGRIMADERVKEWFDEPLRVLTERPIAEADGKELRPDRVVWTRRGTVDVIDYKTGSENPKAYSRQVKNYITALEKLGFEKVRGFLWYIDSGKVVEI